MDDMMREAIGVGSSRATDDAREGSMSADEQLGGSSRAQGRIGRPPQRGPGRPPGRRRSGSGRGRRGPTSSNAASWETVAEEVCLSS